MDYKVGDMVEIHNLQDADVPYDRTFNGLKGVVRGIDDGVASWMTLRVKVVFFKGQRRRWGYFSPDYVRPLNALDAVSFGVFMPEKAEV